MTNNNEDAIQCIANGAVSLFYDNSKKFETLTDGVKTSGDLTVNNANKLYLENDSENKTSYLFNLLLQLMQILLFIQLKLVVLLEIDGK